MNEESTGGRVVVTGASSGIGAATAIAFARLGCEVGMVARRADRLSETATTCRELGATTHEWIADLSDLAGIAPLATQMTDAMGGVDVLINNAGSSKRKKMQNITVEEFDAVMDINFNSAMRLTLALLPHMLERGAGHIVNVGSSGTRKMCPRVGSYVAAKAALDAFTEGLYLDLVGTGVEAHLVIPGATLTEFGDDRPGQEPAFPVNPDEAETPENVALAIVASLATDDLETYPNETEVALAAEKRADFNGYLRTRRAWFLPRPEKSPEKSPEKE